MPRMTRTLTAIVLAILSAHAHAIAPGVLDRFESGTTQEWSGAISGDTPTGGPGGAGDHYLEAASGTLGSLPHLAIKNAELRWTGDFIAAGVTQIEADVKVFDGSALQIRAVIFGGSSGFTRATSTIAISVPADAQWHHIVLPIAPANLTIVLGPDTPANVLQNATSVMLRHNSGAPSSGGTPVSSLAGFDNIKAGPAPVPGDTDNDGDVDLADVTALSACRSGPTIAHNGTPLCTSFDFDHDSDVDQDDFGVLQRCYSGAGLPGDPHCAD